MFIFLFLKQAHEIEELRAPHPTLTKGGNRRDIGNRKQ